MLPSAGDGVILAARLGWERSARGRTGSQVLSHGHIAASPPWSLGGAGRIHATEHSGTE